MKGLRLWFFFTTALVAVPALILPTSAVAQDDGNMDLAPIVSEIEQLTGGAPASADETTLESDLLLDDDPLPEEAAQAIPAEEGTGEFISNEEFVTEVLRLEEGPAGPEPTTRVGKSGEQLISIALDNVLLEDVVRMFTRVSGANIVATSSNLEGTVTVNLVDVEWRPALSSILDMHGLSLVERIPGSGVFSIVPVRADAPVPMVVKTLFLNYTTVDSVSPVVKSMLIPGATLSPFASRNAMVLRSTDVNIGEITEILKLIDIPGQQVCIETKFMELSDEASRKLGISWDSLDAFGARLGAGPFTYDRTTERSTGDSAAYSEWDNRSTVDTLDKYYDVNNAQYEVVDDIKIVEATDSDDVYLIEEIRPTVNVLDTIDTGKSLTYDAVDSFSKTITESQSAILELDSFNLILSALKKTDGVSVISNPKIIVSNGDEGAVFSVGDREPIIRTEIKSGTTDSPGDKILAELDTKIDTEFIKEGYLSTGIELEVVPVIKSDHLIEAYINPSLRRKIGTKEVGGNEWPIISVKNIKTRFTLRDSQTVAIGGLTNTEDSKKTSKIPFLGDIPLIGKYLFSHEADVKKQVETIIFVTLSLAEPQSLADSEGIPENSTLVHKKLLQTRSDQRKFKVDLEKMRQAVEAEEEAEAMEQSTPPPESDNETAQPVQETVVAPEESGDMPVDAPGETATDEMESVGEPDKEGASES